MFVWTLFAGSALAATTPPADTLKVDYFSNANTSGAPDATVRLTNPGTAAGNMCASMFVFDENQELTECCSCLLTPDGLRTLSVNVDLNEPSTDRRDPSHRRSKDRIDRSNRRELPDAEFLLS
jgi:hypothetical protein